MQEDSGVIQATVDDAQARLADLIAAAERGEDVFITSDAGRVARIVAVQPAEHRPRFGSAGGRIRMSEDFDEPLPEFAEYR